MYTHLLPLVRTCNKFLSVSDTEAWLDLKRSDAIYLIKVREFVCHACLDDKVPRQKNLKLELDKFFTLVKESKNYKEIAIEVDLNPDGYEYINPNRLPMKGITA
jgi:hypothetical protein